MYEVPETDIPAKYSGNNRSGCCCVAFLDAMNGFAGLGEDVRVLGWWEHAVEIGFVEAFADLEYGLGGSGRCEGELVWCYSDDRTVLLVQGDVMLFGLAGPC